MILQYLSLCFQWLPKVIFTLSLEVVPSYDPTTVRNNAFHALQSFSDLTHGKKLSGEISAHYPCAHTKFGPKCSGSICLVLYVYDLSPSRWHILKHMVSKPFFSLSHLDCEREKKWIAVDISGLVGLVLSPDQYQDPSPPQNSKGYHEMPGDLPFVANKIPSQIHRGVNIIAWLVSVS